MADKCSSASETDEFEITSQQEQSSDADDSGEVHTRFSSDIHVTTPTKKRRWVISEANSHSNDSSRSNLIDDRSMYYSSDDDSGKEIW